MGRFLPESRVAVSLPVRPKCRLGAEPLTHFFFHLPKTGGTSLKRVLEQWFVTARDEDCTADDLRRIADQRPDICLHGHFGGSLASGSDALFSRYPWIVGDAGAQVFTFLRDPVEHAISVYYHEREHGRTKLDLIAFLAQTHRFGFADALAIRSAEDIEPALTSFAFVGVTEELQACVDRMAVLWGKPSLNVPTERIGARDDQVGLLTRADRARLEQMYALECEAYARVRDALAGGRLLTWSGNRQFQHLATRRRLTAQAEIAASDTSTVAQLTAVIAHNSDKVPSAVFNVGERIGVTLRFEILDQNVQVEPAIGVARDGRKVFVAAFTPAGGASASLSRGASSATVWIPPHLLNPGVYEIDASLATPHPVKRHDATAAPLLIEVVEAEAGGRSARGNWKGQFPGAIRPLLD